MRLKMIAVFGGMILSASGASDSYAKDFSVEVNLSTLGVGFETQYAVKPDIGIRLGANYFKYDYDGDSGDVNYNFDLSLMSVSTIMDFHPFMSSFRVSGGLIYDGNKLDAKAFYNSTKTYDVGGVRYSAASVGTLKGSVDFNHIAYYIGVGWDTSFGKDKAFGFLFDVGAVFQGSPHVSLSADGPIANDPTFQQNLKKEQEALKDDVKFLQVYPLISTGVCYRF